MLADDLLEARQRQICLLAYLARDPMSREKDGDIYSWEMLNLVWDAAEGAHMAGALEILRVSDPKIHIPKTYPAIGQPSPLILSKRAK